MVAMLVLLVGALPRSAFASLFTASKCAMPCCVGKPAHLPDDPDCAKECDEVPGHDSARLDHDETVHAVKAARDDPDHRQLSISAIPSSSEECNCTIRSGPVTPDQPLAALAPSAQNTINVDGLIPERAEFRAPSLLEIASPGVYGTDSGPPTSWPNYATFGRAPPVLLA